MPYYRVPGVGMVHMKMTNTRKRPAPPPCRAVLHVDGKPPQRCCAISTLLCDWPLEDGGTCDMPLCAEHAGQIGPDQHLCIAHLTLFLSDQERGVQRHPSLPAPTPAARPMADPAGGPVWNIWSDFGGLLPNHVQHPHRRQHDSSSGFVDCGDCHHISTGCRSGRCEKAMGSGSAPKDATKLAKE